MFTDELTPRMPEIPVLNTPSITPTVTQVSFMLDDININSGPTQKQQPARNSAFSGTEFQSYQSWRSLPTTPPTPIYSQPRPPSPVPLLSHQRSSPGLQRGFQPTPPPYSAKTNDYNHHSNPNVKSEIQSALLELKKELPSLITECLEHHQRKVETKDEVLRREIACIVRSCLEDDRRERTRSCMRDASTNTELIDKRHVCVQVQPSCVDNATETDSFVPVRELEISDPEIINYDDNGPTFYRNAQEQLKMAIRQSEDCQDLRNGSAFAAANRNGQDFNSPLRRPIPMMLQQPQPMANNFAPPGPMMTNNMPHDFYRAPSDVSVGTDAFLRRHLPPEKLVPSPRYVFNMTNVSLAMGYPPEQNMSPMRDWNQQNERYGSTDRILDLTAIRRQPKLL